MILGIGCDLLEIARLEKLVQKNYCDRIFTEEERRQRGGFQMLWYRGTKFFSLGHRGIKR